MWNSVAALSAIAWWSLVLTAVFGGVAVITGLVGGVAATRAADIKGAEDARSIAEANARAEEARLEAARANERLRKAQTTRRLTKEQTDKLSELFRSDVFQDLNGVGYKTRKLRVSSVEDSEARMHAMEWQNLMESCGVNIYPTVGGLPSTCVQLSPDAEPLTLTVKSDDVHDRMQHLAHFERTVLALGLKMGLEYDPALQPDEGILHVMRKRAE